MAAQVPAISAGTILSVSAVAPATWDAAGYAALTWAAVGEIEDIGEISEDTAVVTRTALATTYETKIAGITSLPSVPVKLALSTDDAGQILVKASRVAKTAYSYKLTLPGGDIYYFRALCVKWGVSVGAANAVTAANATLEMTYGATGVGIVESLAA